MSFENDHEYTGSRFERDCRSLFEDIVPEFSIRYGGDYEKHLPG